MRQKLNNEGGMRFSHIALLSASFLICEQHSADTVWGGLAESDTQQWEHPLSSFTHPLPFWSLFLSCSLALPFSFVLFGSIHLSKAKQSQSRGTFLEWSSFTDIGNITVKKTFVCSLWNSAVENSFVLEEKPRASWVPAVSPFLRARVLPVTLKRRSSKYTYRGKARDPGKLQKNQARLHQCENTFYLHFSRLTVPPTVKAWSFFAHP